ncbi:Protein of unknown function [Propionibacterium freudenreichii]|nr:Protein of unknown function [Propionibacterium freudenreichii]
MRHEHLADQLNIDRSALRA